MRRSGQAVEWSSVLIVGVLALVGVAAGHSLVAQEGAAEMPESGFRADYLMDLARLEQKVVGLAEAVPADKYDWRPAAGVRSVSEVYMHLAGSTFQILQGVGRPAPDNAGELEKITDKVEVIETLKGAFAAAKEAMLAASDDGMDENVEFFGRQWSKRAVFYLTATHIHEHLGQSIAYARSIGVVPPWSAPKPDAGEGG